jgi:hypothetical protein
MYLECLTPLAPVNEKCSYKTARSLNLRKQESKEKEEDCRLTVM